MNWTELVKRSLEEGRWIDLQGDERAFGSVALLRERKGTDPVAAAGRFVTPDLRTNGVVWLQGPVECLRADRFLGASLGGKVGFRIEPLTEADEKALLQVGLVPIP